MALNCQVGTLTQPGSTGNQTISLPANFDPKVIKMMAAPLAAAGTGAGGCLGYGVGTYRSSTVAQRCLTVGSDDNATTSNTQRMQLSDALLAVLPATLGSGIDLEIDLVSMQGGATSQVVINWTNLFTTASVLVHYMILGGSDITDALVGNTVLTTSSTTQNVTVASGFGQPDYVECFRVGSGILTAADTPASQADWSLGFGKKGENGRLVQFASLDAQASAQNCSQTIYNNRILYTWVAGDEVEGWLSASGSWPTDGYQLTYNVNPSFAEDFCWLAMKGTFTVTTGQGSAPTSGTPTQTLTHGSPPSALFLLNARTATANTLDTSSTNCGVIGVGMSDGTNEAHAGTADDDALGTSNANRFTTNTKAIRYYDLTPTLTSEADSAISGNDFTLAWNDSDATAFLYQWVTLGSGAAAQATWRQPDIFDYRRPVWRNYYHHPRTQ